MWEQQGEIEAGWWKKDGNRNADKHKGGVRLIEDKHFTLIAPATLSCLIFKLSPHRNGCRFRATPRCCRYSHIEWSLLAWGFSPPGQQPPAASEDTEKKTVSIILLPDAGRRSGNTEGNISSHCSVYHCDTCSCLVTSTFCFSSFLSGKNVIYIQ